MLSYNVIAVGTDGSPTSLRAVQSAASMARAYDSTLIIVSAFYNHSGSMLGAPNSEDARVPVVSEDMSESYLNNCLLYTSPSPRDRQKSRMPSSA